MLPSNKEKVHKNKFLQGGMGKGVANKIVATIRASTMISFLLEVSYLIIYYKVGVNQNLTVHKIINFKGCHIGL